MAMVVLFLGTIFWGQMQKPIGICELLRNVESYNGQIVTIRAFVVGGLPHGYYLVDNRMETPCSSMPDSRINWPPTIDLIWPGSAGLERVPLPFERDIGAQKKFYESMRTLEQKAVPGRMVEATFVGQVRTRRSLTILHNKQDNVYAGNGYGQFGMHPAQLVIKTVLNITTE
jgi:hypothetical protein